MFQSVLSVVVGYLVMAIIVMIGTIALAAAIIPGGLSGMRNAQAPPPPSKGYLYANLALSLVAAVVGGWLTARMAPNAPFTHAAVLAAFVVAMGVVSARNEKARQPSWYPWTIAIVGVAGVLIGGVCELRSVLG